MKSIIILGLVLGFVIFGSVAYADQMLVRQETWPYVVNLNNNVTTFNLGIKPGHAIATNNIGCEFELPVQCDIAIISKNGQSSAFWFSQVNQNNATQITDGIVSWSNGDLTIGYWANNSFHTFMYFQNSTKEFSIFGKMIMYSPSGYAFRCGPNDLGTWICIKV